MNTPTSAEKTSARNKPVPTASRIAGMMMNTDDAGVIDDSVIITLPTTRSDRESSCSERSPAGAGTGSSTASGRSGTTASPLTAASDPTRFVELAFDQCRAGASTEPSGRSQIMNCASAYSSPVARRKDQAARRRQLTQAARRAIAARGVEGVRVKDVAAEAGLSSQAVLYYYPALDDLIEEAIQRALERFAERRFEAVERSDDPRRALVEAIAAGLPAGADDEDLRVLYGAAAYLRDKPALGALIRSLTDRQ